MLICHYYLVHKQQIVVDDPFTMDSSGVYHYSRSFNPSAVWATLIAAVVAISCVFVPGVDQATDYSWFIGCGCGCGCGFGLGLLRPGAPGGLATLIEAREGDDVVVWADVRIKVINPNTTWSMTKLIADSARSVAGPGVQVDAVSPSMGPVSIESRYDEALAVPGILNEVSQGDEG